MMASLGALGGKLLYYGVALIVGIIILALGYKLLFTTPQPVATGFKTALSLG
jgi:hypothetical protein